MKKQRGTGTDITEKQQFFPNTTFPTCFLGVCRGLWQQRNAFRLLGSTPLSTAQGERNLISEQQVMTYPTATSPTQTELDTFYTQTICPSTLTAADCALNEASLNTSEFGNFNVVADPMSNNPLWS